MNPNFPWIQKIQWIQYHGSSQFEEFDADGEVSRVKLFAMDSIPLLGAEQDSDSFESDDET